MTTLGVMQSVGSEAGRTEGGSKNFRREFSFRISVTNSRSASPVPSTLFLLLFLLAPIPRKCDPFVLAVSDALFFGAFCLAAGCPSAPTPVDLGSSPQSGSHCKAASEVQAASLAK